MVWLVGILLLKLSMGEEVSGMRCAEVGGWEGIGSIPVDFRPVYPAGVKVQTQA